MASDLFHDAARAYYGVGPEVYTLANIATHGNAPAGYALGCDSGAPSQYEAASPTGKSPSRQLLDPREEAMRLSAKADKLSSLANSMKPSDKGFAQAHNAAFEAHKNAHGQHSGLLYYFRDMPEDQQDKHRGLMDQHHSQKNAHWYAIHPEENKPDFSETGTGDKIEAPKSSTGGGYVKPELPPIEKQPASSPGQKMLFACSQPYAFGDARTTGTGSADDDPQMKRKSADGTYPAQARPISQSGHRITLPGDYNPENASKPDFSLTGTGTRVKVPESKNCAKSGCGKSK